MSTKIIERLSPNQFQGIRELLEEMMAQPIEHESDEWNRGRAETLRALVMLIREKC